MKPFCGTRPWSMPTTQAAAEAVEPQTAMHLIPAGRAGYTQSNVAPVLHTGPGISAS